MNKTDNSKLSTPLTLAELEKREAEIDAREDAFVEREQAMTSREHAVKKDLQSIAEKTASLTSRETAIKKDLQSITDKTASLTRREQSVQDAERQRDTDFADARANLAAELGKKRAEAEQKLAKDREKRLLELDDEFTKLRATRLDSVAKAENAERERIRAEIARELAYLSETRESTLNLLAEERKRMDAERLDLERQKSAHSQCVAEFEGQNMNFERREQRLDQILQRRAQKIDDEVADRIAEKEKSMDAAMRSKDKEIDRLRDTVVNQIALLGAFDALKRQLGDREPAQVILELNSKSDEIRRLHESLATRPTEEMRERYQSLETELNNKKAYVAKLEEQVALSKTSTEQFKLLEQQKKLAEQEKQISDTHAQNYKRLAEDLQQDLNRERAAKERPIEVEARYQEIKNPHFAKDRVDEIRNIKRIEHPSEIEWLKGISNACNDYGLHFNPRILYAFHTALKTAEWAPLTVLAGVSGTGKSELPRLYSHFGGFFFEPIAVQPNWDSQESMLGFFNSIDNRFDAQPILRFLAQSQEKYQNDYPGLNDAMCLVLLDEMNLAHPELYFAEFLSKLELRRGKKRDEVPFLPVKIGAGLPPFELKLGRNVLWVGTMNQDETTKSLSDKVIDRSIIINFPRPNELKRRIALKPLDNANRGPVLARTSWDKWLVRDMDKNGFTDNEVKPFLNFVTTINSSLEKAGRALGHRVWQSIEYYMANYPDVRAAKEEKQGKDALDAAMHTAFEDQIVQKIMPKLRGLDTRGKNMECLNNIRAQLVTGIGGNGFNLDSDFDLACELGYGQFMWQTANYLNNSADAVANSITQAEVEKAQGQMEAPAAEDLQQNPAKTKVIRRVHTGSTEMRVRVRELATELRVDYNEVMSILKDNGYEVANYMSNLDAAQVELVRKTIGARKSAGDTA